MKGGYRDLLYLEELALPDSILTVLQPTLEAFAEPRLAQ